MKNRMREQEKKNMLDPCRKHARSAMSSITAADPSQPPHLSAAQCGTQPASPPQTRHLRHTKPRATTRPHVSPRPSCHRLPHYPLLLRPLPLLLGAAGSNPSRWCVLAPKRAPMQGPLRRSVLGPSRERPDAQPVHAEGRHFHLAHAQHALVAPALHEAVALRHHDAPLR